MENFKEYMDRVHTNPEIKENTKKTVAQVLRQVVPDQKRSMRRKRSGTKAMAASLAALAAFLVVGGAAYAYYETPVDYLSLDINPSVELGINAFQKVVRAHGINQDGADLIENLDLHNMSAQEAVRLLVVQACQQDYISEDGSTVVVLSVQSDSGEQAEELGAQSALGVGEALQQQNALAILYGDTADLGLRTRAQEMGVSAGKYKLMLALQAMDPSLDLDSLKNQTMTQIMLRAGALDGTNEAAAEFAQTIQSMQQIAVQIRQQERIEQPEEGQQNEEQTRQQEQNNTQSSAQASETSEEEQSGTQTQQQDRIRTQDETQASCEPTGSAVQNQNEGEAAQQEQANSGSSTSDEAEEEVESQNETQQGGQAGGQDTGGQQKGNQ